MIWETRKIGHLPVKIIDGDRSAKYPKKSELTHQGYLFLNSTNIKDNRLELGTADYVTPAKFSTITKGRLQAQDIVMTTRGSVGKVALFNSEHTSGLINAQMLIFRSDDMRLSQKFLFYTLTSDYFQNLARNFSSGSAQPQLPIRDLKEILLPVPPLETQRRIAAILSAYDDLIENNQRRIKVLEEMAQLIYREWFVHFRFPGHEGVRMVDSELGEIPERWRAAKLGDIAEQVRRSVQPSDVSKETPYIGLEHLPRKSIALSEWTSPDSVTSSKLRFYEGEILFGKIRPYFHKVGIAPVDGICSSDIIVIRPKAPKFAALAAMVTSSDDFVLQAVQTSQGTKMPRANWDVLVGCPVFLPDESSLNNFTGIVANITSQIRTLIFKNQNLRRTRDLLLPKLISGELEVLEAELPTLDAAL